MTFAAYPSLAGRTVFVSGGSERNRRRHRPRLRAQSCARRLLRPAGRLRTGGLAREIAEGREHALFLPCDVTDIRRASGRRSSRRAKLLGPIAVLVNNAANDERHAIDDVSVAYWDHAQNVNLRHHFFAAQAVRPQMRELGFGSIVNLSSIAWRAGASEMTAYSAAKAGVVGLTFALARAFGPDNIRVNAIEPGAVMTERQRQLWYRTPGIGRRRWSSASLIRTTLLGEEVARAALFLAADDSRMITKQSLTVDAGLR